MPRNASSRRRRAAAPKYCHHKGNGQAYVTLKGRQIYLGAYDSPESHAEYERLVGEFLLNGRIGGEPGGGDSVSINELLLAYLQFAKTYYHKPGDRTDEYKEMRLAVRQLKRLYGMTPAIDFGPLQLKSVQRAMIESGLTRQGVNRRVSRIVRVFMWGVENEMVDPMVHHALGQVSSLKK